MNRSHKAAAVAVAATALAAACSARAESIYLKCEMSGPREEKFTIDLSNNTVDNKPARINETAIDWEIPMGGDPTGYVLSGSVTYHIDRTAGTLTEYATYNLKTGRSQSSTRDTGACSRDTPPTVKF